MQIGMKTKDGIQKRYGTRYDVGSISEVLCTYSMFLSLKINLLLWNTQIGIF